MNTTNIELNEEVIEEIYKELNISIEIPFNLEKISQDYQESVAMLERESYSTTAYINR